MKLSRTRLLATVPTVEHSNVSVETYCKPKCAVEPDCITFDAYSLGGYISCSFSSYYGPLEYVASGDHWERRRWCTSLTGKSKLALSLCVCVRACVHASM